MQIRGTDQRTALNSNQGVARLQWLVRKLSRREGGALALPLSLAVLAVANARGRDLDEDLRDNADKSGAGAADAQAPLLKGGERIALIAGDTVLLEHLLTEADVAAGQVRVAMRRIESAHAAGVRFEAAQQAGSAVVEDMEAVADAAAEANAQAEGSAAAGEEGDAHPLAQPAGEAGGAAVPAPSAGSDAAAAQEDDEDHGLMWLVLGIGAAGAGLMIAHDDNDGSPPQLDTISGQVVKGYVEGAAVYLDIDGDGLPDGDPVYTDAEGRFTLQTSHQGASIVVYGGVDTLTNVPFDGLVLRAPAGSTVVTPITTLLDAMLRQDPSLDVMEAQSRLLDALGVSLPAGTDLRNYDPVAGVSANGGALEDQSEAVLNTIAAVQSILTGAGAAGDLGAADAAINALARAVLDSGNLDLTSAADVQAVLEAAFTDTGVGASDPEDMVALAGAIASVNGALTEASGLGEEALQVTRYAFSSFQDLLSGIGAGAHSTDGYERDISFSSNSGIADAVNAINGGGLGEVIAGNSSLSISFAERLEGGRFALALNPELKFHNGAPDTIDTVAIRFDAKGVLVQMETRGANGKVVVQTLVPDEEGYYHIAYGNLDKIFFQTPMEYNGQLGIDVRVHYVGLGITAAPPTLHIHIDSINDAPAASDASVQATEDQAYVFSVDDFPFTDARDAASASGANQLGAVRLVSLPVRGTLFLGEHAIDSSDLVGDYFVSAEDIASGRLRYLPGANDNGDAYASFQFQVRDDGGTARGGVDLDPAIHTLTVNVAAASDAPVAINGEVSLYEDGTRAFTSADFGFTDVDGDTLAQIVIVSLPATGTLCFDGEPLDAGQLGEGGFAVSAVDIGLLTWAAPADYNGSTSFQYQVRDSGAEGANLSNVATMDISVTAVSDAPVAGENSATLDEDATRTFSADDFAFTDADGDKLDAVLITSLPTSGELRFDGVALGEEDVAGEGFSISAADLGRLSYVPEQDFNGGDNFRYRLRDAGSSGEGENLSAEAGFALSVTPVSDRPTATPVPVTIDEDGAHTFEASDFGFADVDGDSLTALVIKTLPQNGVLEFDGTTLLPADVTEGGFVIAAADIGLLRFVPDADFNGTASFMFRLQDGGSEEANKSIKATLEITVNAVNDAPVIRCIPGESLTYAEGGEALLLAPSAQLSDVELDALNGGLGDWSGASISIARGEGGHGHQASREDRFGFRSDSEELRFEDGQIIKTVDDVDLVIGSYQQRHGRLQISFSSSGEGAAVPTSADVQQVLRSVTYLNTSDNPQESVTLAVTVRDGNAGAQGAEGVGRDVAHITVNLVNVNDAPEARHNQARIDEDELYCFNGSDFRFRDAEGNELQTLIITGLPENGTLYYCGQALAAEDLCDGGLRIAASDIGHLSFRPDADFHGNVQFTYRLQDDGGIEQEGLDTSNEATFRISVRSVNDAPEFSIAGTSGSATPDASCEPSILVNTTLAGSQEAPRIAALADGGYVVVWTSRTDGDVTDYDVYGQRFNAAGGKVGGEFRVTDSSAGYQAEPTVVALPWGGFAVLWTNRSESNSDIQVRTFSRDGHPSDIVEVANTHTAGNQVDPAVAGLANGVVVVWASDQQDGSGYGIYARVANGGDSGEFRVNTTTNFNQVQPAVAMLADGSFVVTWTSHNSQGVQNLHSRRFTADGSPIDATEVAVNVQGLEDHYQSSVSGLADGGYVVAWTADSGDETRLNDVYVQRYGADGQPVGEPQLVNTEITDGEQREPAIAGLPSGGFMVTWTSWGSEESSLDVYAQRFGADGLPLGGSVLVNSNTDKEQTTPAIAVLNDGTVVVTWQSNTEHDGADYEIHAQHFQAMTPWFIEGATGNREDVVPVRIAAGATVFDAELSAANEGAGDWSGAKLVLQREGGNHHGWGHGGHPGRSSDHFEFQGGNGYTVDADGLLLKDGELIGRMVERNGRLTVEFGTPEGIDVSGHVTRTPTNADVNFVLQHIAYWNSSDNPGDSVVLQYRMEDGNGRWFGAQGKGGEEEGWASVEVKILNVNDAPEARHNGELLLEDHSHTFDSGDFRFRDAEGDGLQSVTITSLPEGGKLLYCGRELDDGDLCGEDGGFTIAACDLDKLVFVPEEDFHGQVEFTYFLRDDGGTGRGGQDTSAEATFRILVAPVNDAPELDLNLSGYTFVVTTLEDSECDDGKLSLREALAQARDGDSIAFAANLSGGTINLNGSPLIIGSNVYINGLASGDCEGITLQTTGAYSAIEVTACVTDSVGVVLSGLNIAGGCLQNVIDGPAGSAAAIINGGTLTLHEVGISGYHQTSDGCNDVASVLWNREGAQLYISGLDVQDNMTTAVGNYTASLVLNQGSLDLVDAAFHGNVVVSEGLEQGGAWLVYNGPGASFALAAMDALPGQTVAPLGMGQGDYYLEAEGCEVDAPASTFCYVAPDLRPHYTEDDACAVRLMLNARITDVELDALNGGEGDWSGASIVIAPKGEGHSCHWGWWPGGEGSEFGLADGGNLSFADGQIIKGCGEEAVVIGTYGTDESGALVISFPRHAAEAAIPTSEDVNNVLRLVTYRNTSQNPEETVPIGVTVSDGNGRFFGGQGLGGEGRDVGEITVVINAVNDAPTFDFESNPPVVVSREEDETYVFSSGDFPFVDVEGHGLGGVIITALPESGYLVVDGRIVTFDQVGCDGFFVSAGDIACGRFTFQPAPDQHGVASFDYKVRDNGGTDHGGEDTTAETATFTFDVRSVNDAPKLALSTTADYTFVVTTLDDSCDPEDGKLSLREALALACDGDSITFDPSLLSCGDASIVLGSTLLIDKQVYINGAIGDGHISLLRDHCMEGVLIEVACEVGSDRGGAVLQGLVLDGECVETASAALANAGHLVLHDVTITDQNTVNDCGDAVSALLNLSGGVLVATALTVSGNTARAGEGDDAYAILNLGRLTVDGLVVSGNTQEGGDSVSGQGGDAFALFNAGLYYQGHADFCGNTSLAGSGDDCGCDAQGPGSSGDTGGGEPAATGFALQFLAPALTGSRPDAQIAVLGVGEAVRLAPDAVLSDVELDSLRSGAGNWSGARIEISRIGGADASDEFGQVLCDGVLQVNEAGQITKLVDDVPRVIGSFTTSGGVLAIHFTGHGSAYATTDDVNEILRSLTYRNTSSEFEGDINLRVTVRDGNAPFDGPQGAGANGGPGEGIVTGIIQVHVEQLPLATPESVVLLTDTACEADGITGNPGEALQFRVQFACAEDLVVGQEVRLYRGEVELGSRVITQEDLGRAFVTVSVSTEGLDDFGFSAITARVAANASSSRESDASAPYFVTYDTAAPAAPVVDELPPVVISEANPDGSLLVSGTAEAFSTITVSGQIVLGGEGGTLQTGTFTTQADASGRFSLLVALPECGLEEGDIELQVVATDRAGNASEAVTVNTSASWQSTSWVEDEDTGNTDGFLAGGEGEVVGFRFNGAHLEGRHGTEWFLAPASLASSLSLDGRSNDYTITLVEGDLRDAAIAGAPQGVEGGIIADRPLYLVEFWAVDVENPSRLYLQVDTVHFSDGTSLGLTVDGIHVLDYGMDTCGTWTVQAGAGNESVFGSSGNDVLYGGDGNNLLVGGAGNDYLISYGAADHSTQQPGDVLLGGEGDDILVVLGDSSTGEGPVHLYGGSGHDIFAVAPVSAADLDCYGLPQEAGFNRDVTIHDFVIGEDRIDLSWLYVSNEGEGYRRINAEDLGIDALAADLAEDGRMEIDLSRFVTADGTELGGSLVVQLAGGSAELTECSFLLGEMSMLDHLREDYLADALRVVTEVPS